MIELSSLADVKNPLRLLPGGEEEQQLAAYDPYRQATGSWTVKSWCMMMMITTTTTNFPSIAEPK